MAEKLSNALGIENAEVIEDEATWLQWRETQGGSSDAPALFDYGYASVPSQWTLWALKSGKISAAELWDEDDDRIWYGKELQALTARAVTRKMGWELFEASLYVRHADPKTRMASTVDFYCVNHDDGLGIIECKNRDYFRWLDDYTETEAAMKDKIQLAHQFACHPKITWGAITVLVGGNQLKVYPYQRDALKEMIADLEKAWTEFWQRVSDDNEPALTGVEIPNWLKVHQEKLGEYDDPISLDGSMDEVIAAYNHANETRKSADKIEKACKAKIMQAMNERGQGFSNSWRVKITYSEIAAATIERKASVRATMTIKTNDGSTEGRPVDKDAVSEATKKAALDAQAPLD